MDPADLPAESEVIYVGLNPLIARTAMQEVVTLAGHGLEFFYP